jgi:hypothetical protein
MTNEGGSPHPFRRRYDYDPRLLPNPHMEVLEAGGMQSAGQTMGYPAWNLLYYTLYCSIPPELKEPVVVETGTNHGLSTIVMAQALKDIGARAVVRTVEIKPDLVELAKANVADAGLSSYVEFHVGRGPAFLAKLMEDVPHVDFAFLDDLHTHEQVVKEVNLLHPKLLVRRGKVYFDNSLHPGVASALRFIRQELGGNLVEFENCSWGPPGNAVWQPD